jgi:hypothetical protein
LSALTRKDEHGHTGRGSAVENRVADIAINAIAAKPNESEAIRQAGPDLFGKAPQPDFNQ